MAIDQKFLSQAERLALLDEPERAEILASFSTGEYEKLLNDWNFWARPNQLPPEPNCPCGCNSITGTWLSWIILAGRGWGKTRTGAEWVHNNTNTYRRFHLVGPTASDIRDIMIEGPSGVLATQKSENKARYMPTKRKLEWANGAVGLCFSADEPERLRGEQCFVADTMVSTPTGPVPIQDLRSGDLVITRQGVRHIIDVMVTLDAEVGRVRFSNGAELVGTSNHPVLMSSAQWISLRSLNLGTLVCAGESGPMVMSLPTPGEECSPSIWSFGSIASAPFPQDITSITRIETGLTTTSPTWSFSPIGITTTDTLRSARPSFSGVTTVGSSWSERTIAWPSVSHAPLSERSAIERRFADAVTAGLSSYPAGVSSVVSVASTWEDAGRATVYNLSVAEHPEYIANGVVVHNCEAAWADELAAWRYTEAWSQLQLGLRLGPHPQTVVTTTPRPTPLIKRLVKDPRNHVTKGSTFENVSNLADAFVNEITQLYEGTRFGRQELYAEILDDAETALWSRDLLELTRVEKDMVPRMKRIVVGVDPAISFGEDSAETGIVVCGLGMDGHAYVLQDASGKYRPEQWARKVAAVYHEWQADKVIAEKNQGYDLVEHTIRVEDPSVAVKLVWAARNKIPRAEPISTAYEKGRAHHVGMFLELEEQMCTWEAGNPDSPDRLDAMVWAMTELIGKQHVITVANFQSNELAAESSYWKGLG